MDALGTENILASDGHNQKQISPVDLVTMDQRWLRQK